MTRSLGRAGHAVTHLRFAAAKSVADASRYCVASVFVGDPYVDLSTVVQRLVELSDAFDVVIPITDGACEVCYAAQCVRDIHLLAPLEVDFRRAQSKLDAQGLVSPQVKAPPTKMVHRVPDPLTLPLAPPFYAKPVVSVRNIDGVLRSTSVARIVNVDQFDRHLRDNLPIPVMTQPEIGGQGIGINFVAYQGELLGVSLTERLHEPLYGGGSSYRRTGIVTERILGIARSVSSQLHWTGFMMIECKRQGEDLFLMEINCRPWGSINLSIFAGADFPALLIDAHQGRRRPLQIAKPGVYARHLLKDMGWALRHSSQLPLWVASFRRPMVGLEQMDVEQLGDPLPALAQVTEVVARLAGKAWKRLPLSRPTPGCPKPGQRLLFVCKGNINRSYVAARIAQASGLSAASACLLRRSGRLPSRHAESFVAANFPQSGQHQSKVLEAALRPGDAIIAFERRHISEIRSRVPGVPVYLLSRLAGESGDIADPDGKSDQAHQSCFVTIMLYLRKALGQDNS